VKFFVVIFVMLLLTRLIGQFCFARWRLSSSSVTLPVGGRTGRRACGRLGGRHCTAGQYGYGPLGRHLVCSQKAQEASEMQQTNRRTDNAGWALIHWPLTRR